MSKSNATENDLLQYMFNSVAPAWAGDGNWYLSLHSSDPGEGGTQTTNEISYTTYDRVLLTRSGTSKFTVVGPRVSNTTLIQFPLCTAGSATATYWAIGRSAYPTAGQIMYSGPLTTGSLSISVNITPQFSADKLGITED